MHAGVERGGAQRKPAEGGTDAGGDKGEEKGNPAGSKTERTTSGHGRRPERDFEPFREVEVPKAIRELALRKSPGPDGVPAEVCKISRACCRL